MKFKTVIMLVALTLTVQHLFAQSILMDKKGKASFYSEAPMEDIEATNEAVIGALDVEKGTLAVSILIKDFQFDNSLMEEHFNENYMESEEFPKATFKGKLVNLSKIDFDKPGVYESTAEGELTIHGVTKPLTAPVKLTVSKDEIDATTEFDIAVADFDIEIPRLVIKNIAEVVEVKAAFNFIKKK